MKLHKWICSLLLLASLLGCVSLTPTVTVVETATNKDIPQHQETIPQHQNTSTTKTKLETPENHPSRITIPQAGYTHQRADGNRFVSGAGQLPRIMPIDIPLPSKPSWVVGIPWNSGSFWVTTLEDGQVLGFQVKGQEWQLAEVKTSRLKSGQPPYLLGNGESPSLLIAPSNFASPLTHAISLFLPGFSQAFIDIGGNLILMDGDMQQLPKLPVEALPDARILKDERGRLLLLTGPTEIYDHAVLGDAIEANSVTRVDTPLTNEILPLITMPDELIIEGIAPIWADLNGDSVREIIVTASSIQKGAQILVFNEEGQQIAAGPAIGTGYRWRHQIAVAPFGPNNELELVDVLTPHLGGVVEFYQWEGNQLKVVAQLPGYTSHIIGSRNLDMAAAGDFDGDGQVELLLPDQARSELAAIRRTGAGAEAVWSLALDAPMITNLGAVTLLNGSIAIGIGQENGILRIWQP